MYTTTVTFVIAGVHPIVWLQLSLVSMIDYNLDYCGCTVYSVGVSALMYTNYCYLCDCRCTSYHVASIVIGEHSTF